MFGLDAGGSVLGMAYQVAAETKRDTVAYLYERELVTHVYAPRLVRAETPAGSVHALTFTVDRKHRQYAGRLSFTTALDVVRDAQGKSGPNSEYVLETARTLHDLSVHDATVQGLATRL